MRIVVEQMREIAQATGFEVVNIEKVLRLKELLAELAQHPDLSGKLVLKGGTAINLFVFKAPRLSVDIDLNYVGEIEREAMLNQRPTIEAAIDTVGKGLRYQTQAGTNAYALYQIHLAYTNHLSRQDRITLELNFLHRTPVLEPIRRVAFQLGDEDPCKSPVLANEELFGGKMKAFIDRAHPRDLYDLTRWATGGL